jgi:hypothetical protein
MPRMMMKGHAPKKAVVGPSTRYEHRFVNGVHTVFDRVNIGHGLPLGTAKEAARVASELNQGKLQWTA